MVKDHKLEAEFKQCRKLLNAIGDENRQHLICVMMKMPIDGGLVLEIVEQTHHPGCHSLIWKRLQGSHLRKPKNLQYGDRTQNHGQYKNPYTKIWTKSGQDSFILMPATTRPRPHSWKMLRRRAAKSWMVLVCPVPEGCSDRIMDRTEGSTGCDAKRIKGDYPGRKWEVADGMIL